MTAETLKPPSPSNKSTPRDTEPLSGCFFLKRLSPAGRNFQLFFLPHWGSCSNNALHIIDHCLCPGPASQAMIFRLQTTGMSKSWALIVCQLRWPHTSQISSFYSSAYGKGWKETAPAHLVLKLSAQRQRVTQLTKTLLPNTVLLPTLTDHKARRQKQGESSKSCRHILRLKGIQGHPKENVWARNQCVPCPTHNPITDNN